ncbi:hypothetical protein AB9F34_34170, partial [Rhizobium leguminosarum]
FFYALLFTSDQRAKTLTVAIADLAAGEPRNQGALHDENDQHWGQGGEHACRRDQSVIGNAAAGEIGNCDGQRLGALVRSEEQ